MKRLKLVSILVVSLVACGESEQGKVDPATAPSGEAFRPVSLMLVDRCGSLDCHGSKYRNMRLHGFGSFRADPTHKPDSPETTPDEDNRNYDAVVGLEPEVFRAVIADKGRAPERLTFVRKARWLEAHKGEQKVVPGDNADLCILSWLGGTVDPDVCRRAVPRLRE